jgi:hypothetical protein
MVVLELLRNDGILAVLVVSCICKQCSITFSSVLLRLAVSSYGLGSAGQQREGFGSAN